MVLRERHTKQQTYQVRLSTFTGPLDLLLHLIECQELDITAISLAQITDQYLSYLHQVEAIAPDDLTEFLVIAARLLLIKSRVLLPSPSPVVEEHEDIGEDLVRQLREYRLFKQIAQLLQQRDQVGQHMYTRTVSASKRVEAWEPRLDLSGTSSDDLTAALHALLHELPDADSEFSILNHAVTIDYKITQIGELLRSRPRVTFAGLLDDVTSKADIIVTLLAILEMIRDLRISVQQKQLFGEILIVPGEKYTSPSASRPDGGNESGSRTTTESA